MAANYVSNIIFAEYARTRSADVSRDETFEQSLACPSLAALLRRRKPSFPLSEPLGKPPWSRSESVSIDLQQARSILDSSRAMRDETRTGARNVDPLSLYRHFGVRLFSARPARFRPCLSCARKKGSRQGRFTEGTRQRKRTERRDGGNEGVVAENHLPDNRIIRLALSTASQFEVMRHSRLRRTIGLPRHAGTARRAFLPYPIFRLRSSSFPTPLAGSSCRAPSPLAPPDCYLRLALLLYKVHVNPRDPSRARVKSHPIPLSFRANNRASRNARLLFFRFTGYPYSVLRFSLRVTSASTLHRLE